MIEQNETETWLEAAECFEREATWLGDEYRPQLKALKAYASHLDAAGDALPMPVLAEYARLHRFLLNKRGRGGGGDEPEPDGLLDMFLKNPGASWKPEAQS